MKKCPNCPSDLEVAYWHNCFGTYNYADGSEYVGEWKDDKQHGQGTSEELLIICPNLV